MHSGVFCDSGNHVREVNPVVVSVVFAACPECVERCPDLQSVKQPDQPTRRAVFALALCISVVDAPSAAKLNLASWEQLQRSKTQQKKRRNVMDVEGFRSCKSFSCYRIDL